MPALPREPTRGAYVIRVPYVGTSREDYYSPCEIGRASFPTAACPVIFLGSRDGLPSAATADLQIGRRAIR